MEVIIYTIPFITALFLLLFFNKKMVWWEYVVLIIPSILVILITHLIMIHVNSMDIEYLGSYVTRITYYEEWDEMVWRTKTRRVPCGVDSNGNTKYRTETYHVREREYHPEKWVYVNNESETERKIDKNTYNTIKKRLSSPAIFRDMKRKYHRIDGDAYDTYWNKSIETIYDITTSNEYVNKVRSKESYTIFKMENIDEKTAKEYGLYDYPDIKMLYQTPIIGGKVTDKDIQRIRYINAIYGKKYQFRMYILIYENKDISISELQKAYWQNGNKNEFVVCLGVKDNKVVWSNSFSWCDEPKLEVLTRDYFIQNPVLDINAYGKWIQTYIPNNWKRKEFKDFDYINIGISKGQYIGLLIFMTILSIAIAIILVLNNIKNS